MLAVDSLRLAAYLSDEAFIRHYRFPRGTRSSPAPVFGGGHGYQVGLAGPGLF